jgi:ABC-type transport system involved in cytochrome c biogenesis permease subunit
MKGHATFYLLSLGSTVRAHRHTDHHAVYETELARVPPKKQYLDSLQFIACQIQEIVVYNSILTSQFWIYKMLPGFYLSLTITVLYFIIAIFFIIHFFTSRRFFSISTIVLLVINLLLHAYQLITTSIAEQRFPLVNLFEALSVLAFFTAVLYLLLHYLLKAEAIGVFVFPMVFTFHAISTVGVKIVYLKEELFRSPLFMFHTISTLVGYGCFVYSMVLGVMYLYLFRELRQKKLRLMFDRLPPLELLDTLNNKIQLIGFIFLSLGIVAGLFMAHIFWGTLPLLDPKIFLSLCLWFLYLFGILMRRISSWSGRRMSFLSVIGFAWMVFSFLVVRLIFITVHNF